MNSGTRFVALESPQKCRKTVAKVSLRIVPRQKPEEVISAFREWVNRNTPKGIKTEVRVLSSAPGLVVNPDHPAIRIAARAFGEVFGKETVFIRSGGSIPIVGDFATHLGIPTILMFKGGQVVGSKVGAVGKADLQKMIDAA